MDQRPDKKFRQGFPGTSAVSTGFPGGTGGKELPCQCKMQETWVPSLGQEDPLEEGMTIHSSILGQRSLVGYSPWGCKESDMTAI